MGDFEVERAGELEQIGRRLREMGGGELKKALLRGIRETNKPTIAAVRANARSTLPRRGGLAELVAKSKIGTRTRLTGQHVGVEIKGTGKIDVAEINRGVVRHPVFGNKKVWAQQKVPAGWFTKPVTDDLPRIHASLERVMAEVARKIEG